MGSFVIIGKIFGQFQPSFTYQAFFLDTAGQNIIFGAVGLAVFLCASILETRTDLGDWVNNRPVFIRWCGYFVIIAMIMFMGNFDAVVSGGFEYAQF